MKTIRKTLIPVSAILAAATLPTAALAELHVHKKVDRESIVVIGNVVGKTCILIDDMVDTAGTLCMAAKELKE